MDEPNKEFEDLGNVEVDKPAEEPAPEEVQQV